MSRVLVAIGGALLLTAVISALTFWSEHLCAHCASCPSVAPVAATAPPGSASAESPSLGDFPPRIVHRIS